MNPVQDYSWQQFYDNRVPSDLGVTSPQGYSLMADPEPPYVLNAAAMGSGTAPVNYNPAAMLYTSGSENQVLMASGSNMCGSGCVDVVHKPDPRVHQVKPLYQPHVFQAAPGTVLPTVYNVVGMY